MALQQHGKHLRADEPAGRRRQRIRRLAALDGQSRRDRRRRGPGRQIRPRRPGRQHVGQRGRTERHAGRRRRRQRLCGRHLRLQLHQGDRRTGFLGRTDARHARRRHDRRREQQRRGRLRHRRRLGQGRRREDHVVRDSRQVGVRIVGRRTGRTDPRHQVRRRQRRRDLPEQLGIHRRNHLRDRLDTRFLLGALTCHGVLQQICGTGRKRQPDRPDGRRHRPLRRGQRRFERGLLSRRRRQRDQRGRNRVHGRPGLLHQLRHMGPDLGPGRRPDAEQRLRRRLQHERGRRRLFGLRRQPGDLDGLPPRVGSLRAGRQLLLRC